jgi:hypothetical protein
MGQARNSLIDDEQAVEHVCLLENDGSQRVAQCRCKVAKLQDSALIQMRREGLGYRRGAFKIEQSHFSS